MNDRSRYHARNPDHPVPERSASEYLNIPYDAEFEAWYESDFKKTGWTTPFLKYQGPGNSTNIGEPVTEGDFLAKVHDLRYAHASYLLSRQRITKQEFNDKIEYADAVFVDENSKYTPVGWIGRAGIGVKQFIEKGWSYFGEEHIYPGSDPQIEDYSAGDEEIDVVEVPTRAEFLEKNHQLTEQNISVYDQYYDAGDYGRQQLASLRPNVYAAYEDFEKKYGGRKIESSALRPIHLQENGTMFGFNVNGTPRNSAQWQHGIHMAAGNKFRNISDQAERDIAKAKYIREQHLNLLQSHGERYYDYFKPGAKQFNLHSERNQGELSTSGIEKNTSATKRPSTTDLTSEQPSRKEQTIENNSSTTSSEQAETSLNMTKTNQTAMDVDGVSASSANTNSGGSGISTAVDQIYIAGGFSMMGNRAMYKNSFRMRSFGNALFPTAGLTTAALIQPSTVVYPHVALPVEYLWFYMPEGAYTALSTLPQCRPVRITCKVTPIGQMVSFGTNSEATQTGTTSHTLYGSAVVGLSSKIPCDKVTITRNAAAPMTLASVATLSSSTDWIQRLWGAKLPTGTATLTTAQLNVIINSASNHEVIFPNSYLRVYFPTPEPASATQVVSDAAVANSYFNINKYMPKFPMQPKTGTPIVNFEYEYHWPIISGSSAPVLYTPGPKTGTITVARRGKRGKQSVNAPGTTISSIGVNQADETGNVNLQMAFNSQAYSLYNFNNYPGYNMLGTEKHLKGPCVPSVHVGIEAVKSNVPEAATTDYINASCDFYVETSIEFEFNGQHDFNFSGFSPLMDIHHSSAMIGGSISSSNSTAASNVIYRQNQPLYP